MMPLCLAFVVAWKLLSQWIDTVVLEDTPLTVCETTATCTLTEQGTDKLLDFCYFSVRNAGTFDFLES